jgi:hypothetical protein
MLSFIRPSGRSFLLAAVGLAVRMSYVIVRFPELRDVYIDDKNQGSNNAASGKRRALFVNAGIHTFRLGGPSNVDPPEQKVDVLERPMLNADDWRKGGKHGPTLDHGRFSLGFVWLLEHVSGESLLQIADFGAWGA